MSRVFQCDRCKTIFEPRVLQNGEPYIARKGNRDIDLCPKCYELLKNFLSDYDNDKAIICRPEGKGDDSTLINKFNRFNKDKNYKITDVRDREKLLDELRPNGEWIEKCNTATGTKFHICSNCSQRALEKLVWIDQVEEILSDYCPNCGADMRKEKKNET